MTIETEFAAKTIEQIRERAAKQRERNRELLTKLFRESGREGRKPPGDFGDSSYLFMRSVAGDNGVRPLPGGTVFWLSPDMRIRPISGSGSYTQTLEAGHAYIVECDLRNRGDLAVPSAKVELFLTDPTIGFDTRFATKIGIGATWVPGVGSGRVDIPFQVPPSESGHKCLIARTFSFSPLDLPLDDTNLSPPIDRHVAQLNINILPSATALSFNLVHQPNFEGVLQFRAATLQELLATGHPILGETRFVENARLPQIFLRGASIEHVGGGERHRLTLENDGRSIRVKSQGDGPSLDEQKQISGRLGEALKAIAGGEARPAKYKEVFQAHRKLGKSTVFDSFVLKTPRLNLEAGETTAVHLEAVSALGETVGGFTLLLTA